MGATPITFVERLVWLPLASVCSLSGSIPAKHLAKQRDRREQKVLFAGGKHQRNCEAVDIRKILRSE